MTDKTLLELTELVLKKYNPCGKKDKGCIVANPIPCCQPRYLGNKGKCKIQKLDGTCDAPFDCRIWICRTAIKNTSPECFKLLKMIETMGIQYGYVTRPYLGSSGYRGASEF